jgi:glycosyltransferase involved in cell wall biosynthesis
MVAPEKVEEELAQAFDAKIPKGFRFLFFAGAQRNKRISALPEIAAELSKRGESDFVFVTTMPEEHEHTIEVIEKFRSLGMEKHHCNLGPVPPPQASSLIHCMDAMCTFSRLESFSNNFIEAWRMGKPLLATDADWAQDSCGDAAIYLDPDNAAEAADRIANMMNSEQIRETIVAEGTKQLSKYPTAAEKVQQYLKCVEEARRLGPCPASDKKNIHWPKCGVN